MQQKILVSRKHGDGGNAWKNQGRSRGEGGVCTKQGEPSLRVTGAPRKNLFGVSFPPPARGRMPARRFGGGWSPAKQEKSLLGEIPLQKPKSAPPPPLSQRIRTREATKSGRGGWRGREPGLCFDFNPQM